MIPDEWYPLRRDDGEVLGWIRPEGELWVPVSLLGREVSGPLEWPEAEAVLTDLGLGWLAEIWSLELPDGTVARVRIAELTPERVVVHTDNFGAIEIPVERHQLAWPAPSALRPRREDDPIEFPPGLS